MDIIRECPECSRASRFIKYGKFTLRDGSVVQRIKCTRCKKCTLCISERHLFFNKMHVLPKQFNDAIRSYAYGEAKAHIAKRLKTRPNTVINWIKRVRNNKHLYRDYLINILQIPDTSAELLFEHLAELSKQKRRRRLIAMNKSRAKMD